MIAAASLTPAFAPPPARRRFRWGWFLLALVALGLVLMVTAVVAVAWSFRMGGDARALRQSVFAAAPGRWERQFELGVGRLPVSLARAGVLHWAADLDPVARAGIESLDRADVGVYRRVEGRSFPGVRDGVLEDARRVMAGRGWEPAVMTHQDGQSVAVFLPAGSGNADRLEVCVLVLDPEQLVLVSGSVHVRPLFEVILPLANEALGEAIEGASEACASFRIPALE